MFSISTTAEDIFIEIYWAYNQSGTKPNLLAKIVATKFGFEPEW